MRCKPTTCVRNRKDLKPKWIEQWKTQFRAFAGVNTEANRSMLPSLKTKSRDNNNRFYIEKQITTLLEKFTTSSGRTLRSFVPSFRVLLDSDNYKYSDLNLAHVLTPVRVIKMYPRYWPAIWPIDRILISQIQGIGGGFRTSEKAKLTLFLQNLLDSTVIKMYPRYRPAIWPIDRGLLSQIQGIGGGLLT